MTPYKYVLINTLPGNNDPESFVGVYTNLSDAKNHARWALDDFLLDRDPDSLSHKEYMKEVTKGLKLYVIGEAVSMSFASQVYRDHVDDYEPR